MTKAINGFKPTLDLSKAGCYILPRFVSDSQEVVAATDAMNSYLGANVTYDFNPATEVVDASVISQWVTVDADMNVKMCIRDSIWKDDVLPQAVRPASGQRAGSPPNRGGQLFCGTGSQSKG